MTAMKKAILDSTSTEQVGRIFQQIAEQAEGGDIPSTRIFLEYTVGKPTPYDALVEQMEDQSGRQDESLDDQILYLQTALGVLRNKKRSLEQEVIIDCTATVRYVDDDQSVDA
jgi:hypothetical protein